MSEQAALYAALAKAQAEYGPVDRSAVNPHFQSRYAPLDKVLDAITPALTKHGLCRGWRQSMATEGEGEHSIVVVTVTAFIAHAEGQSIESSLSWGVPDDVQKLGAALTYMRRYTMEAIAGVAADSDDDGNGAAGTTKPAAVNQRNAAKTKAAIDAGAQHRDDEETQQFTAALAEIRWTLTDFKAELVDYAKMKVPRSLDKRFPEWPAFAKDKARELFKQIKADAQPANNQTFTAEDDIPG